jgi:hypothetical protein
LVSYLNSVCGLREVDRTVSAQAVLPSDAGNLLWPTFFPRQNVRSVKIGEITIGTFRPVASRREWNGPGRAIPVRTPSTTDLEIIPVEAYFTLGEKEEQELIEATDNNEALMLNRMAADLPGRTDGLAEADLRRIEVDALGLWTTGNVVQDDPHTGRTYITSFGFPAGKMQTAGTAWTTSTAYANFMSWLADTPFAVGGVALRQATYNAIEAGAPNLLNGYRPTRRDVEQRITDVLGRAFTFLTVEDTLDLPVDGGIDFTNTKKWGVGRIAAIPADGIVGRTAFAPVARAAELSRNFPQARVDRNGVAVFYHALNEGKGAKVSAQVNALSIPDENKLWTMQAGI